MASGARISWRARPRQNQAGVALLLILLIAMTVGLSLLFASNQSGGRFFREQQSQDSLSLAKAALIGYSASYKDQVNPLRVWGYLPCPDADNDGTQNIPGCTNSTTQNHMGRFPFKTLHLDALRDSSAECLWYAVSASHKIPNDTSLMNWDLRGNIQVNDLDNNVLAGPNDANGGAVAVIFSPGPPLASQSRSGGVNPCHGDTTNGVTAWLDDPGYAGTVSGTLVVRRGVPGSSSNNDQVLWISPKELWDPIAKRTDLLGNTNQMLSQLSNCLNAQTSLPLPATITNKSDLAGADPDKWRVAAAGLDEILADSLESGNMSPACVWSDAFVADLWANWKDHVNYVTCKDGSPCLTLTPPSGPSQNCTGILLYGGRNANGQPRTAADKATYDAYFEGPNRASMNGTGTNFTGPPSYNPASQSQDLAVCLNPTSPPPVTFADGVASVTNTIDGKQLVELSGGTLTLGAENIRNTGDADDPPFSQLAGCAWIGTPTPIRNGFRAYFRFWINRVGPGFTFAAVDGASNSTTSRCGSGGRHLGYSGTGVFGGTPSTPTFIDFPKLAVEFDTQFLSGNDRIDPASGDDHVSIVFWGNRGTPDDDNVHGQAAAPGDPSNPPNTPPSTFLDNNLGANGKLRTVRIELHANDYDGTIGNYTLRAWVNMAEPPFPEPTDSSGVDFADTTRDLDPTSVPPKVSHTFSVSNISPDVRAFGTIRFGFTGANGNVDQLIEITEFEARSR